MRISEITRRDIADAITIEKIVWSGRLEEPQFLSRVFDLGSMSSTDHRYKSAADDIWKHRVANPNDWNDDWVFSDARLNLMGCDDELFLRFLCETIHPVVRPDATEAQRLCQMYNLYLKNDGFQLIENTRMSGRPIFAAKDLQLFCIPGIGAAKDLFVSADASYVARQITRMEASVISDPDLAIGTAKELVETCCKTILHESGVDIPKGADLPTLSKLTGKLLQLTPDDIPDKAKAYDTIKRLLSNLATITQGISELRNQYGTGHGRVSKTGGLTSRHAKLAVGAAATLAVFLVETHEVRKKRL